MELEDIEPLQNDVIGRKASTIVQKAPKITALVGFTLMINVLMGTGPIYLPGKFLGDGWLMSTLFMTFVSILSYLCFDYIIEAMSNYNALLQTQKMSFIAGPTELEQGLTDQEDTSTSLIDEISSEIQEAENQEDQFYEGHGNLFRLKVVAEFGQMCRYMWGKGFDIGITCVLTFYLCGVLISKTIASSNILSVMFQDGDGNKIPVIGHYMFWLGIFSIASIFLSFRDIAGIKMIQTGIVLFRFFVIFLLLLGPLIYICQGHGGGLQPIYEGEKYTAFHLSGFQNFFSTAIFGLLCHHSISSMMSNVAPASSIRKVGIVAFGSGGVLFILISILGIIAFQGEMVNEENLSTYTNIFRGKINWIYYIASFYMFLNIAAFPILIITMRNNIMKCFMPDKIPKKSHELTRTTVILTVSLITPIILLSIFAKDHIEDVINVSGGVFGVVIMMILPSILTILTRKRLLRRGIDPYKSNPHLSYFSNEILAWTVFIIGWVCLIFNLTQDIIGWVE